jgi:hypothetical protein
MSATATRVLGLVLSMAYAAAIVRVYVRQPVTIPEVTGSLTSSVGVYRIDQGRFDAGLAYFRNDKFLEARDAFAQADPARQDPTVQFYMSYSYLREGWGRVYNDSTLYRAGKATLDHAREIAPHGTILVNDPQLKLHSAEELEAEFDRGLTHGMSDLNPRRLLRERP